MIIGIPGNLGDGKSSTMAMMAKHYQSICTECNGIINRSNVINMEFIEGNEPDDCRCITPKPYKIHANFWLNLPDVHYVTTVEDIDKIHNGFAFLDEFWSWIDSRVSGHSDTNLVVTGMLHKSRKRGYNVIYESKLIHMTDRRIRELTDYILRPNKYISIDGELTKIEQNMLYPFKLDNYIDDTWFIVDLISGDGDDVVQNNLFQYPLSAVVGLYDTTEEISNLSQGESSPGLEKGMKIESKLEKAIKQILPDSEILRNGLSRKWDLVLKANGHSAAFDVVSVRLHHKSSKNPSFGVRGKHITSLLKEAHKAKLRPMWAYFYNGKWFTMPMLESHAIMTEITCRDAKELKEILS